jgi:3-oxoacyl-[acyl-carrier protein] reductase
MILKGKHVLITGGALGIGKALAERLVEQEALVTVLDLDEKALEETRRSLEISCLLCDVSKQEDVAEVISKLDPVDILVNNAAIVRDSLLVALSPKGFTLHSLEDWKKTIDTNLSGVFYMSRAVVEKMIRKRIKGLILNVSSITAVGNQGQSAYSASKSAIFMR